MVVIFIINLSTIKSITCITISLLLFKLFLTVTSIIYKSWEVNIEFIYLRKIVRLRRILLETIYHWSNSMECWTIIAVRRKLCLYYHDFLWSSTICRHYALVFIVNLLEFQKSTIPHLSRIRIQKCFPLNASLLVQ